MASPVDIRNYLRSRAAWVWNEQGHAFDQGLCLQEETLTEMLLLRMARDHKAHGLNITLFNKHEEKKNGADWEWLIRTPFCEVTMRIQAKRLYHMDTGKDYGGLGPNSKQAQKLIARAGGAEPLYVFFNHDHGQNSKLLEAGGEIPFRGRSFWGCSIAAAQKVAAAKSNKLADLLPLMKPWHRLLTMAGGCGLPEIGADAASAKRQFSFDRRMVIERIRDRGFLSEYLLERELAGVAFFDFSDFRSG